MYNNYPSDGSKKICTVTAVDLKRAVCKCVSDLGEILSDVRWLVPTGGSDGHSSSTHPVERSKVLVDISSGFPFILGAILSESADSVRRPNVGRQDADEPQIADYTTISTGDLIRGPGTPRDQRVGDIINTTDGGGMQGVLSSGTVVNKASPLAQILCSRFGDTVRIVSRNFEHFTDLDETYKSSTRGRIFGLQNTFRNPTESRQEIPSLVRMEGDTLAAELVGKNYAQYTAEDFPDIPEDNGIVTKEYTASEGAVTSTHTRDVQGNERLEIVGVDKTVEGQGISEQKSGSQELYKAVHTGETSTWRMNEEEFHWDSGGGVLVTGRSQYGITMRARNGATIEMTNEGEIYLTAATNITINNKEGDVTILNEKGNVDVTLNEGNMTSTLKSGDMLSILESGNMMADVSGDSDLTTGGVIGMTSGGDTVIAAGGTLKLTGTTIQLN